MINLKKPVIVRALTYEPEGQSKEHLRIWGDCVQSWNFANTDDCKYTLGHVHKARLCT